MRNFNYLLSLFFFALLATCSLNVCLGQTGKPYFKHLTRDDGISSNKINCITQDKFGFIWLGTEDGISRYDGVRFKIYKTEQGLTDSYVNSIACDPDNGNLWIGTRQGISFFNRKEERFYNDIPHLSGADTVLFKTSIYKVFLDSRRHLWVGSDKGLFYFNQKISNYSVPVFKGSRLISKEIISDVYEDSRHQIWLASSIGFGIYNPEKNYLRRFMPGKKLNVRSISEDSRKNIWVSTSADGIFLMKPDGSLLAHYEKGASLLTDNVIGVVEDEHGKIWIGARDGGGLYAFNYGSKNVEFLSGHSNVPNDPNSIASNAIGALYKDSKGYIWVGTYAGLNYYDPYRKGFIHYKVNFKPSGLFNSNVRCFYQDSEGQVWVGTRDEGGISKFNTATGEFVNYKSTPKLNSGLTDGNVLTLTELDSKTLLIGTNNNGLFTFNKGTKTFSKLNAKSANSPAAIGGRIGMVHKDQHGKVWVASISGLYTYNDGTLIPKIKIPSVRAMLEYNKDEVYFISLFAGMYHYNRQTGHITQYRHKAGVNSLSNDRVNSIRKDRRGNLWVATNNGLNYFDVRTKRFKVYSIKDGLPSKIICGILIDGKDNLWLSTVNGLVKFSPSSGKVSTFNSHDGLQGNEFEKGVCFQTKQGEMLFGGTNGFNYFRPDNITPNPLVPTVVLTDLKIFNRSASIGTEDSPLKQSVSFEKDITFKHNQNFIEFEFAGLSFTSPEKNQYAYKLDGLETEWNTSGSKTSASYTGLQPGEYVFRVRASNNDGVWNKQEVALNLEILPPWWQTITFQLLVFVALVCAAVWFYNYRTKSLRMQKRKLDILVKERTEVIQQQNTQLEESRDQVVKLNSRIKAISEYRLQYFTNISHEFRTPLTLIIGPVNRLLSKKINDAETEENLLVVKRNAGRLLHLINELMDFRSLENKSLPLMVKHINPSTLTDEIAILFQELAKQKEIAFSIEHVDPFVEGYADATKLQKVIFNLISNAFNYTNKGGTIKIRTQSIENPEALRDHVDVALGKWVKNSQYFEISISDSGIGISDENLTKVFKPFYRESITNKDTKGTGLGLSIVKELVSLHKGIIAVKSKIGVGTEFIVRIPLSKEVYHSNIEQNPGGYDIIYNKGQVADLLGKSPFYDDANKLSTEKGREHVLVVEDNEELLGFITQQLSPNYKVTQARNGVEGLKAALKYTPDIVVSDVIMPEMTGVEMCKKLKDNIKTTHIPVILLTAKADVESQIEGIESGADDYISKPFEIEVFKLRIHNLIQSRLKLRKLFSTSPSDIPAEVEISDPDADFLAKVISIIRENISNADFGAAQLADQMCVSPSLLQKKISRLANHSPTEFITLHRMKKALELIKQPGATVAEVGEKSGFRDPYYFSRCFKKHFGKSPKVFVESLNHLDA